MSDPGKRILMVEGDSALSGEWRGVLEALNYEVVAAASAKEAQGALELSPADLVLVSADGNSKGIEFCKSVRSGKKTKSLPVILTSAAKDADQLFAKHQKDGAAANGYIKLPTPPEDVVDWIERLIGLPPPPNGLVGAHTGTAENGGAGGKELRREIEELQEQIHFYQKQLDQVSMAGEKESREMDQILKELQEDVDRLQKEKEQLRSEFVMMKNGLAEKDREIMQKEKTMGDLREQFEQERTQLREELEDVRNSIREKDEKHKKAQNALREYYKPKVTQAQKAEKKARSLEEQLISLASEVKLARDSASKSDEQVDKLRDDLEAERKKGKKIREALEQTKKLWEDEPS